MAKRRKSPDEAREQVNRVQELTVQDRTVAEACREVGLAPATYYRYRKIAGTHIRPALRKNWTQIARDWRHPLLDQLSPLQARNLRYEVAQAVRARFGIPAPIRQAVLLKELRQLELAFIALIETYEGLGHEARGIVNDIAGRTDVHPSFASEVDELRHFANEVSTLVRGLSETVDENGSASGGPDHDSHIDSLTVALATLYARYTGKPPTHTYDPYSAGSLPSSDFNDFVFNIFDHFLTELQVGRHALATAMRHAAARIDYTDDIEMTD